ncbi:putative membrane protein C3B8.06 [Pseudocercospora fuligena]|uniref:Putative membrane protein C3B8.06 n=1 Tax=Pseudocercospora fuligena TaxID=685502 RepID=A0A8H6VGI6_9PEZI|nr:putative membrane protein C3B8.06 [Pseudocercospora fuligena]
MHSRSAILIAAAALIVGTALAHGGEEMDMSHGSGPTPVDEAPEHKMASYFRHPEHFGWNLAHTSLTVLAWFVFMPLAIFLSIARSRYHLPAQILFHIVNGLGLLTGFVYNHSTPDLYENNSHHPIGWVVTTFTIVWTLMSTYVAYSEYKTSRRASLEHARTLNALNVSHFDRLRQYNDEVSPRDSRDSGQGTERNSASLFGSRQNSSEHVYQKPEDFSDDGGFDEEDEDPEKQGFLGNNRLDRFVSKNVRKLSSKRATTAVRGTQIVLEKLLLLLGFLAMTSGFIVSGGLFRDRQIFSGLAHYIKGGIFFWYGLLTLGRWMGAFTEFGWAWNIRPQRPVVSKWKAAIPSAEFTESFVIWLYGATNVFMEHMNNWGKGWSPSDLEHLSITVLFFGGGLLGMMLESKWLRELWNTPVVDQKTKDVGLVDEPHLEESERWEEPKTYRIPLNPMPALTIMLLGMMMGAHKQHSMVSTMMHAQWGGLFTAFALARGVTYVSMWLKPPTSHFPSRPPSEIVAAFCLTSGGIMFMNSSADNVWAIESNGLDAMTIFTCTMGITGMTLAWEVVLFAIKGWAVRKERAAGGKPLP